MITPTINPCKRFWSTAIEVLFAAFHKTFVHNIQKENRPILEAINNSRSMVTRTEAAMVKGEESVTKAAETVAASGAKNDEHTLQLTKESA